MSVETKPDALPKWAPTPSDPSYVVAPSDAKQELGWIGEKPPFQWFNWLQLKTYQWLKYFENRTDALLAQYDAVIGSGSYASHASLAALLADAGIASIKNVIVIDHPAIDATIVLNQANMRIEFKRGAVLTKGAATTCLQIDADGVEILGAKFSGFNVSGDKPIQIQATKKNSLIFGCRFVDCVTDIEDNGDNNTLSANVVEV
jgi:hypothetical protein